MTDTAPEAAGSDAWRASLELADWRRRVAALYADVRERAASDPRAAWEHWRAVREAMYRHHPQSPVPAVERSAFRARYWPYDPALRFEVEVRPTASPPPGGEAAPPRLPASAGATFDVTRVGQLAIPFPAGDRTLDLFWLAGYAGGLILPFRDATNGRQTYGAGRYLLDTAKGADLGGDPAANRVTVDFNFAYQPSCAFDPRWACPLAPPENRLDIAVAAGERIA